MTTRARGLLAPRGNRNLADSRLGHQAKRGRSGTEWAREPGRSLSGVSLVPGAESSGPARSQCPRRGTGRAAAYEDCPHAGTTPVTGLHARLDEQLNSFYSYYW